MSSVDQSCSQSDLISFWRDYVEKPAETCSESSCSFISSLSSCSLASAEMTAASVETSIRTRGGLSKIAGMLMVPSQFIGPNAADSEAIISSVVNKILPDGTYLQRIHFSLDEIILHGVICYPKGWDLNDKSHCILFNNPNGITVPQFFAEGRPAYLVADLLSLYNRPILMYDYRGTGINQNLLSCSCVRFMPDYATIAEDGYTALHSVLNKHQFEKVLVWGSSLGGGVATKSLAKYLKQYPNDKVRLELANHDSFTTTPCVLYPNARTIMNVLGNLLGGMLDAETSMRSLVEQGVRVTVLCHEQDPVIPAGARMAEFAETLMAQKYVTVINSPHFGHANLSHDMKMGLVEEFKKRKAE